eukprot:TRINITY_DN12547_c0_g1_i1.p1 TRINITY_DN12547_c0_g1~~TRINITY_DN12547_c0_g1_i1.p1  ORF type:complete len:443 (-),score=79.56 TRINITY_DN12547_c0_g1_i1:29-1357(-)
MYVKQIMETTAGLMRILKGHFQKEDVAPGGHVTKSNIDLIYEMSLEKLDCFKLRDFLAKSKLSQKLNGFLARQPLAEREEGRFLRLESLMRLLTLLLTKDQSLRVLLVKGDSLPKTTLKTFCTSNRGVFDEIRKKALAVILAGGTMQPLQNFDDVVACYRPEEVTFYSGEHVISDEQFTCGLVTQTAAGELLLYDMNHKTEHLADVTGEIIVEISNSIQGGCVYFFQSFAYLSTIQERMVQNGSMKLIEAHRKVFFETKDSKVNTFDLYSAEIARTGNAALFAVMGGRLSEGINFGDNLARAVVVVGLPYPNVGDPEVAERMRAQDAAARGKQGRRSGQDMLTDICMKTVNQTIGRAIRHARDYAAVFLLDSRFARANICGRLSAWVRRRSIPLTPPFQPFIEDFFRNINKKDLSLIHISEPTRQAEISYAVFCLKKKKLLR